jgi:hypothetical protein
MAYEEGLQTISRPAGVDLDGATDTYTGVKLNASGAVIKFAAATDLPVGVLQPGGSGIGIKSGDPARIAFGGVTKIRVGAAVAAGAQLTLNASGRAVTAVATNYIIGTALTAGAANGSVISALISTANPPKA